MRCFVVSLLVLTACGGDSPRGPIADPAVFLAELPVVECEHLVGCGVFGRIDQCVAGTAQLPVSQGEPYQPQRFDPRIPDAVARGTVVYSAARAGECLDAITNRSCARGGKGGAACWQVFAGTVPVGSVPAYTFECVSGFRSIEWCLPDTCCDAPCEEPLLVRAALGEACDVAFDLCEEGLRCDRGVCAQGSSEGNPCNHADNCIGDLVCSSDGRCVQADNLNHACTLRQCERIGEACGIDGKCHPLRHAGQSCNDTTEWCDSASVCDFDLDRCVGVAGEGEPCFDRLHGPICAIGLYCTDDGGTPVCRPSLADGEACSHAGVCQSAYCDRATKRCAPLPTCP